MTTGELADAAQACKLSMEQFHEKSVIVSFGGAAEYDELLHQLPKLQAAEIVHIDFPALPELEIQGIYAETAMEKQEWKVRIKDQVRKILKYKPEAVFVGEKSLRSIPDRTCTPKETHPGSHSSRKRRTEASCQNSIRFINE